MYAIAKKGFPPGDVAENIAEAMRKDRDQKEGQEDFSVSTFEQLASTYLGMIATVQTVIIGIAAISLVVGGIGIMNTMYTSVLERTHEIGVMKAIGARNSDIMMIFLMESGILGLVGGVIGVGLGLGVGAAVGSIISQSLPFSVSFPPWLTFGALAFSFIIGNLSGALPALSAARMKPAEALRY
jgi:putative ABC transport system permease protein